LTNHATHCAAVAAAAFFCLAHAAAQPQATSPDGRWRVAAEAQTVVVYDRGERVKALVASRRDGQRRSTVAEVHHLDRRRSFVIAFDTLAELWELSVDPNAEPVYDGLVHDWRLREALGEPGFLGVRRTLLDQPLHELRFDDSGAFVLGRAPSDGQAGSAVLLLVQLDVRRVIARFAVPK
jgi:hypothetical protein